jgi:S-(hydroxymethyl)glutathione dehydrogenase / alcohol dehydrogenase
MPDTGGMSTIPISAAVFVGPRRPLSIEQLWLDPPGPQEVLVRMVASGICHSDLHVVDGDWDRPHDVILGHEGAGIVEAVGDRVGSLTVGDLVVLVWTAPCGTCTRCQRGEPWLCATPRGGGHRRDAEQVRVRRADGSPVGVYSGVGTHATHQVVDAAAAIRVDPRTPHDVAALLGCAATTGIGAVRNTARVGAGESVVILGLGGVGLAAVMAAADAGATPIIAIDTQPAKLELARTTGAMHAFDAGDPDTDSEIRRLTNGGADHVLEAIGHTATVERAIDLARPGGTVTLVGMTGQAERARIDVYRFVEDGKRLLGSNYGSIVPARDVPRIAQDVVEGRLPLASLVTDHIPLAGIDPALESMRRRDGARRVIMFGDSA